MTSTACPYANAAIELSFAGPATDPIDSEQRRVEKQLTAWAADAGCAHPGDVGAELMLLLPGQFVLGLGRKATEPAATAVRAARRILEAHGITDT